MNGDEAYRLVCAYADFGIHRTGTPGEAAATAWLAGEFAARGAEVAHAELAFQRFAGSSHVECAGRTVESMPLYFSAAARIETARPALAEIDGHADEETITADLVRHIRNARAAGRTMLALATRCPTEALCAINRPDDTTLLDFPVVLVPGRERTSLGEGSPSVSFDAAIVPAVAHNLVARFPGPSGGRPIVVTTPVSGWFTCAGERGCGIAVALHLATELSRRHPVVVLGATGHELGFLGGYRLAQDFAEDPALVIHLGSCIANTGADLTAVGAASPAALRQIAGHLRPIGAMLRTPERPEDPHGWVGESKCWAPRRRPMLSIAGLAPPFHTPDDLPGNATSPALLQGALDAIAAAAGTLARDVLG